MRTAYKRHFEGDAPSRVNIPIQGGKYIAINGAHFIMLINLTSGVSFVCTVAQLV